MKPQVIFALLCFGAAVVALIPVAACRSKVESAPGGLRPGSGSSGAAVSALSSGSKMPTADSPYLRIFVTKEGVVSVDGKECSLQELAAALDELALKRGVVLYSRDNPEEFEPHPVAMSVVKLVGQKKLPIRLCKPDFSDAILPVGKLRIGN